MNRSAASPFAADKRSAAGRLHVRPPPSGLLERNAFTSRTGFQPVVWYGTRTRDSQSLILVLYH